MSEPSLIDPWIAAGAATVATIVTLIFGFLSNRKLQHLKSQLDLQFHVHRVKFEKEFQILEEVWRCLIELRNAGAAFTPGVRPGPSDESEDMKRWGRAYGQLLRVIDVRKPFFPQEIFDLLEDYRRR